MITMKKCFFVTMALTIAVSLVSCSDDDDQNEKREFKTRELPSVVENANPTMFIKTPEQASSLKSITRLDSLGELYRMDYTADYGLKELLAMGGVKSNNELLGYAQRYLLNIPRVSATFNNDFGCSAFVFQDNEGHYLFCRNFDYVFKSPVSVITRTPGTIGGFCMNMALSSTTSGSPDNGKSDNSFYVAAPLAMVDGMNKYGVAISVHVVKSYGAEQHDEGKTNITTTALIREILDNAKDVEEALAIFDSHNYFAHGGTWQSNYHFLLADASGRSVIVEYVNSGRDNQTDKNYKKVVIDAKYTTNNFVYQDFREPISDTWRESIIANSISSLKDKNDAFKLLLDTSQTYDPDQGKAVAPGEVAGPNSFPETLWSVVYDLTSKQTYFITGRELKQGKAPFLVPMMQ